MLTIENLHVAAHNKHILTGVSLRVLPGEIHAVMGPNGSGKSTLAYTLMGHPGYEITRPPNSNSRKGVGKSARKSTITFNKKNIAVLSPDERSIQGIFLAFQSPIAIPGVSVKKFLRHVGKVRAQSSKKSGKKDKSKSLKEAIALNKKIDTLANQLSIKPDLLKRDLNDNFSGGEKKKIETLQMLFLKPKLALIDEVDTGLDVDALQVVANGIKKLSDSGTAIIIITHYQRILKYVKPDHVHVMRDGRIVKSGSASLAKTIEDKGYTDI